MANVTATARIGTRVIRCVGVDGECNKREIFGQLDLFLEHARRQAVRAAKTAAETANRAPAASACGCQG